MGCDSVGPYEDHETYTSPQGTMHNKKQEEGVWSKYMTASPLLLLATIIKPKIKTSYKMGIT